MLKCGQGYTYLTPKYKFVIIFYINSVFENSKEAASDGSKRYLQKQFIENLNDTYNIK